MIEFIKKKIFFLFFPIMLFSSKIDVHNNEILLAEKYQYKLCFLFDSYCFINITKNASTSMRTTLNMRSRFKYKSNELKNRIKIIVLRNPYSRIISSYLEVLRLREDGRYRKTLNMNFYKNRHMIEESFDVFLDEIKDNFYDTHCAPQIYFLREKNISIKEINYILFFETLEQDYQEMAEKEGFSMNLLNPFGYVYSSNKDAKKRLREFIENNEKIRKKIYELYKEDFDLYDEAKKIVEKRNQEKSSIINS
jgi:hypothetical protein